jgi:hypothetical protein
VHPPAEEHKGPDGKDITRHEAQAYMTEDGTLAIKYISGVMSLLDDNEIPITLMTMTSA